MLQGSKRRSGQPAAWCGRFTVQGPQDLAPDWRLAGEEEEFLDFIDEGDTPPGAGTAPLKWPVLIVDDDRSVHEATLMALAGEKVHGRTLEFLHAYSAAEALRVLAQRPDIVLVLLDVIMETPDAGLRLVAQLRGSGNPGHLRILIRTGQPGSETDARGTQQLPVDGFLMKAQLTRAALLWAIADVLAPLAGDGQDPAPVA